LGQDLTSDCADAGIAKRNAIRFATRGLRLDGSLRVTHALTVHL
jgi:hypothetical protein